MADRSKSTAVYFLLFAGILGWAGWTGDGLSSLGVMGLKERMAHAKGMQDSLTTYRAKIDTAKAELAKESLDDLSAKVKAYRGSLEVLRTLVPEQREVANLLDDITARARVHAVTVMGFNPSVPTAGPPPFDTYSYNLTVVGRYDNIGRFVTDIASLRRIMVPGDVSLSAASMQQARALGDTTAMLQATFTVRTYVKSKKAAEDSTHAP